LKATSILVTGANGFVGKVLCAELFRQGFEIRAIVRSLSNKTNGVEQVLNNVEQVLIETIDIETDWTATLKDIDIVIHLAARVHVMNDQALNPLEEFRKVNVDGTLALAAQAAKAGVKRFIFISSVKVNGEFTETGKPFTEKDVANPQDAYAVSKHEAEQGLLLIAQQTGMEIVIIRPPLIYGAGVKANFASMLRTVKRGMPLPLGAIHNKRSFVYVGNLVSLIECCIDHPAAKNQVFLVSDGHDLSTTELLQECATALNVRLRLVPVPQNLIERFAAFFGKQSVAQRLCGNLQVDISKAHALLGWKPPTPVAGGMKVTALAMQGKE
jgi:nucleoside-diphosphate-sugar epimerase